MTPLEVYNLARAEGLPVEPAIVAVAVAWGESGLNPIAVGDENLEDGTWGPSIGLWQVRSLRADFGTGKERDAFHLTDPRFNARSMVAISRTGTDFSPWTIYRNGSYRKYLAGVRAAVTETGEEPMKVVTRAEWGARAGGAKSTAMGMNRGVAVHWLGETGAPKSHADCPGTMRWVQALHMDDRGWADFAYNAGVCPHGVIYEGRGPRIRNAANGGGTRNGVDANSGWAAILYFDALNDGGGLTSKGKDGINDAAVWLGVAGGEWLGHRDFLSTGCPGDEIYSWVHSGHPRGTAPATPEEEDDDMTYFGDSPDGRPYAFWMVSGPFKRKLHTDAVWNEAQELAKTMGRAAPKHVGKIPVATFDALIDTDELTRA